MRPHDLDLTSLLAGLLFEVLGLVTLLAGVIDLRLEPARCFPRCSSGWASPGSPAPCASRN